MLFQFTFLKMLTGLKLFASFSLALVPGSKSEPGAATPAIATTSTKLSAPADETVVATTIRQEDAFRTNATGVELNLAGGMVSSLPIVVMQPVVTAPAQSASDIVGKVQAFYASIKQVSAKFQQEVQNATFGDSKTSTGKVWISKPGKMRWDYYSKRQSSKVKKSFISNGSYLYVVEHENKQVLKKNLEKDLMPVAVSFLYGKGDLRTDFNAEIDTASKYGDKAKNDIVLKLTPKKPSAQYKNLILVVDNTQFRVKQSVIIDSAGNVNHFSFFEPDFVKPVEAKWFEFNEKSVKSYRIVNADDASPIPASPAPSTPGKTK